jgi:hypothetical protein
VSFTLGRLHNKIAEYGDTTVYILSHIDTANGGVSNWVDFRKLGKDGKLVGKCRGDYDKGQFKKPRKPTVLIFDRKKKSK